MPDISFDWFLLLLRVLFVFLLYFFLYQVYRVTAKEVSMLAHQESTPRTPERHIGARLVLVEGGTSMLPGGSVFALRDQNVIGRGADCSIEIDEPFLSTKHAEIRRANGEWQIRDLGSTNGTYLNGERVLEPVAIDSGDVVQFGRITFLFEP